MKKFLSGYYGNKGVTLITLIIAITIFAVFITVFSYVMIAKHGSEALYVQSTQAYAVAQAGIEYGFRHVTDEYIADPTYDYSDFPITKSFGDGTFLLTYTAANGPGNPGADEPSLLTSTGTIGIAVRKIIVSGVTGAGGGITTP